MGCCESTVRRATASPPLLPPPPDSDRIKAAPSSAVEVEEKVKEVLCETPAAAASKPVPPKPRNRETAALPAKTDQLKPVPPPVKPMSVPEDSKFSTTNADGGAQRRAERSPVKPRPPRTRSFSGELGAGVARGSGKSPTRIRPDGIGGSVRIVQSRDAAWAQRLDLGVGERSGRRSGPGSPAKRGGLSGGGGIKPATDRVPSMRRTDLSPGRVRRDPSGGGSSKRINGGDSKQRRESKGRESLESPLVSLECFIFL